MLQLFQVNFVMTFCDRVSYFLVMALQACFAHFFFSSELGCVFAFNFASVCDLETEESDMDADIPVDLDVRFLRCMMG